MACQDRNVACVQTNMTNTENSMMAAAVTVGTAMAFGKAGQQCLDTMEAKGWMEKATSFVVHRRAEGAWACEPAVEITCWTYRVTAAGHAVWMAQR